MFRKRDDRPAATPSTEGAESLPGLVRTQLPQADEETIQVITALAGLLGAVAYADRQVTKEEESRLAAELGRVHGLSSAGVEAICSTLRAHVLEISTAQLPRYARALRDHADRELRVEVLGVLVDLAASDGVISMNEVNMLRQLTTSLGLAQDDYNAAQARHRERLSFLKPSGS